MIAWILLSTCVPATGLDTIDKGQVLKSQFYKRLEAPAWIADYGTATECHVEASKFRKRIASICRVACMHAVVE